MTLIDDLTRALGDGVISDPAARLERAVDTWSRAAIDGHGPALGGPAAVCAPASTAAVAEAVNICRAHGAPIVARGAGSGVVGGVLADERTVVISTERLNGLVDYDDGDMLATFGAGTNGMAAEQMMVDRGMTIGHWPQSIEISSVGGWVATRASGQYSTAYGNIEDMVYGLEAVMADGSIYRSRSTPRASSGPDLRHLLIGSEGTLGIVTEVTLSVRERPEPGVRQAFHFADLATGVDAIRAIMRAGWRPPVVRLYDGRESWRHFRDQLPKGNAMLIFLHEGPPGVAPIEAAAVAARCWAGGATAAAADVVSGWFEHRNAVPSWADLLAQGIVADTIEIAAEWSKLPALYTAVIDAVAAVPHVVAASAHSSHAYRSGANWYFTVAAAPPDPAERAATYDAYWSAAMAAANELGAGLSHHHGIGRVRRPWMEAELGAGGTSMLRAVKSALDPQGLLNPGVLIP
jgi:alkyldihydroxyacetonephosphate synthase